MPSRYTYTVIQWTTHYRIIDGLVYRDAIARRSDGQLRQVSYLDGGAAVAA